MKKLDLNGVRIYSNTKADVKDALDLIGEEVFLSDYEDFESFEEGGLVEVNYSNGIAYPFFGGNGVGWFKYIIRAEDAKFKKEKETNVNIKEEMNFIKTWKSCHITYLSELPSKDLKVDTGATVAVPGEKRGQFKLYTWFDDDWVFSATIDGSDFELKELEDACADLENAIKKLNKVASNTENEELSSKLSKITTKILQAKYELADEVLGQSSDTEGLK